MLSKTVRMMGFCSIRLHNNIQMPIRIRTSLGEKPDLSNFSIVNSSVSVCHTCHDTN
jgi:hypothetical protein